MTNRPKFIITIFALILLTLMIYIPSGRLSHATVLSGPIAPKPTLAVGHGPSQFYAQHI